MKKIILITFLMLSLFGTAFKATSQNTVTVNASSTWSAWASWSPATGSSPSDYGNSAWGLADIKTVLNVFNNSIELYPNFNTYKAGDPYWANGATGSKIFEGSSFVENPNLAGSVLTFTGNVAINSLASGYKAEAFVKAIDPNNNYNTVIDIRVTLVEGQTFSITTDAAIPLGLIAQYGFSVTGLNANPIDAPTLGRVVVGPAGVGIPTVQMNLPVTFEDTSVDYNLLGFGGADNSTITTDPTLSSNKVAKVVKTNTAEVWAGTTITGLANLGFSSKIPFTANDTKMSVRVWSPNAGIPVRLKVEDHTNSAITCETESIVTTVSGWETLEFNFANNVPGTPDLDITKNYDKATIFFNFGVSGSVAGQKTYYFDDVKFVSSLSTVKFESFNLKMYPNPVKSNLIVEANKNIQKISVYNILGQEVMSLTPNNTIVTLQTEGIQKGVYMVKTIIDGAISVSKIIKE